MLCKRHSWGNENRKLWSEGKSLKDSCLTNNLYPTCISPNSRVTQLPNFKNEQNFWRYSIKEDTWKARKLMKRCSMSLTIKEIQMKDKMRNHVYLFKWPKWKNILTIPSVHEDVWQLRCSYVAGGNSRQYSYLVFSFKVEQTLTIWPSYPTPRYLPQRNEILCPHKNLYKIVYGSSSHNCPKSETTQMSFIGDKHTVGISIHWTATQQLKKKNEPFTCTHNNSNSNNLNKSHIHYVQWKKPFTKGNRLHVSSYMTFQKTKL